ncbi:hypothetical protein NQZ68_039725 [Dissostichus eleginoides]|nr:hypothetical protein NQZ68_039725 [Dissostichus eleginoides]
MLLNFGVNPERFEKEKPPAIISTSHSLWANVASSLPPCRADSPPLWRDQEYQYPDRPAVATNASAEPGHVVGTPTTACGANRHDLSLISASSPAASQPRAPTGSQTGGTPASFSLDPKLAERNNLAGMRCGCLSLD